MKNDKYLANQMRILEESLLDTGFAYTQNIEKQYRAAVSETEKQVAAWYQRFAKNNEISLAEAKRLLNSKELEEFRRAIEGYIEKGKDNAVSEQWIKQLENASARVHISRLDSLKLHLQQQAELLHGNQLDSVDGIIRSIYSEGYYRTAFEVQKGLGVGWSFQGLNESSIQKVLSRPWTTDGQTFSDRIWENKQSLINSVNTKLMQMIMRGEAPDKVIKAISHQFDVSKNKAGRLVMTESAAFASAAQKDCFKALDVERYEIIGNLDGETCELCGSFDGKVYDMSDYAVGSTAPPFHPWCRCCTAPYFEDMEEYGERIARDLDGKAFYVPANTTYEQWKQMQDEKYGEGSVDKARKDFYTRSSDYQQYLRYVDRLGEDNVCSFADFRKMKAADSAEYQKLELRYCYKCIDDRILERSPSYKAIENKESIPSNFNDCASQLDKHSKEVIYKYTDGGEGCAEINTCAATGEALSATSVQDVRDLHNALDTMSLPTDTVVYRGTKRAFIKGLKNLEANFALNEWIGQPVKIESFASTSLFRDTMYEAEVEMTILVPKNKKGAGYVNEISHHHINGMGEEYEVVLQNNSDYAIIEAQYCNDKLILVVEWKGGY